MNSTRQIWAIAKRELLIHHRWWKDILSIVIMAAVIFGIGEGVGMIQGIQNYSGLFVSGMLFYMVAITSLASGTDIMIDRKGFNKILLMAPMPRISIILGKLVYLMIAVLKNYVILAAIIMIYFHSISVIGLFSVIMLILITAFTFIGIAYTFSTMIMTRSGVETFLSISTFTTLLLSGTFYSIANIPSPFRYLLYANPGTYFADMFRFLILGNSSINPVIDSIVIVVLCIAFTFGGIRLFDYRLRTYGF